MKLLTAMILFFSYSAFACEKYTYDHMDTILVFGDEIRTQWITQIPNRGEIEEVIIASKMPFSQFEIRDAVAFYRYQYSDRLWFRRTSRFPHEKFSFKAPIRLYQSGDSVSELEISLEGTNRFFHQYEVYAGYCLK